MKNKLSTRLGSLLLALCMLAGTGLTNALALQENQSYSEESEYDETPVSQVDTPEDGAEEPVPENGDGSQNPMPDSSGDAVQDDIIDGGSQEEETGSDDAPEAEPGTSGGEAEAENTPASDPEAAPLEAPVLTAAPLDEETGEMILTVSGQWDSYTWEACSYGSWSSWPGDGFSIALSKADFVSHGFRCTVTAGDQAFTSGAFAYDESVLEQPEIMLMASTGNLEGSNEYMRYYPVSRYFDIQGHRVHSSLAGCVLRNGNCPGGDRLRQAAS